MRTKRRKPPLVPVALDPDTLASGIVAAVLDALIDRSWLVPPDTYTRTVVMPAVLTSVVVDVLREELG